MKLTLEDIEAHLGPDAAKYARNKRIGGDNNAKGGDFELGYTTRSIVSLAAKSLLGGDAGSGTFISAQTVDFVDDLVVHAGGKSTYSQIKDVKGLTWHTGKHPLQEDYRMQRSMANYKGIDAEFEMVVSSEALQEELLESPPEDLDVEVRLHASGPLRPKPLPEDLFGWLGTMISPFEKVTMRENAFIHFVGAWKDSANDTSLKSVVDRAAELSACVVRPLGPDSILDEDLKEAFGLYPDFECQVRGDTFSIRLGKMAWYVAQYRIGSPEWERFQADVLEERPQSAARIFQFLVQIGTRHA